LWPTPGAVPTADPWFSPAGSSTYRTSGENAPFYYTILQEQFPGKPQSVARKPSSPRRRSRVCSLGALEVASRTTPRFIGRAEETGGERAVCWDADRRVEAVCWIDVIVAPGINRYHSLLQNVNRFFRRNSARVTIDQWSIPSCTSAVNHA